VHVTSNKVHWFYAQTKDVSFWVRRPQQSIQQPNLFAIFWRQFRVRHPWVHKYCPPVTSYRTLSSKQVAIQTSMGLHYHRHIFCRDLASMLSVSMLRVKFWSAAPSSGSRRIVDQEVYFYV
jgi:hypothetical protein